MFVLKNWVKRTVVQDSASLNSSSTDVSVTFVLWRKYIYSGHIEKNPQNDWLYAPAATKKKDVVTKRLRILTFSNW